MSLFKLENFMAASGKTLHWKIECDALTDDDWQCLAQMISEKMEDFPFSSVEGVPTGALTLAEHLQKFTSPVGPVLIVDDVYTTGGSMEKHRSGRTAMGVVVFARKEITQNWISPLFTMLD